MARRKTTRWGSTAESIVQQFTSHTSTTSTPNSEHTVTAPNTQPDAALTAAIEKLISEASGLSTEQVATIAQKAVEKKWQEIEPRVAKMEGSIDPLLAAMDGSPKVRARLRLAGTARQTENDILNKLTEFYTAGHESPANVLLCSPPSFGKSFAVRQLGETYDTYMEHGCSDDMDEISTMLGSPIPDGNGGFIVVDGVLTQAVRTAGTGQTVLLLLDEVLRLSPRAQEWLLTFLTGVKMPDGSRTYRLRTRRALPNGTLEMLECKAANLHIVAATNLGIISPIEAFWSRWEKVRFDFSVKAATKTAKAILASYGISDRGDDLAKRWADVMKDSRELVAKNRLKFPVDLRMLERGCQMAKAPTARAVAGWLADRFNDNLADWNVDTGDIAAHSTAATVPFTTALKTLEASK